MEIPVFEWKNTSGLTKRITQHKQSQNKTRATYTGPSHSIYGLAIPMSTSFLIKELQIQPNKIEHVTQQYIP